MTKIEDGVFKCPFCGVETPVDSTPPSDKREQIAKHLYEYRYSAGYWDTRMTDGDKWKWRNEADQILKLMEKKK